MSLVVGTLIMVSIGTVIVALAGWLADKSKAGRAPRE
jgi:hypothetical protein